jgi:hypothetical protein
VTFAKKDFPRREFGDVTFANNIITLKGKVSPKIQKVFKFIVYLCADINRKYEIVDCGRREGPVR